MLTNKQEIENWLDEYKVINYTINEDLTVDVDGSVDLSFKNFKVIPVKFNIIKGYFSCSDNRLTSTDFFPKELYGTLYGYNNNFKNLDNFPKIITGMIGVDRNLNLENIIGLWGCDFRGNRIFCDKKWKEEVECYLISINRLKEVKIS